MSVLIFLRNGFFWAFLLKNYLEFVYLLKVFSLLISKHNFFLTLNEIILNMLSSYQISRRVFELTRSGSSTDAFKTEGMVLSGFDASTGNVKKDCHDAAACLGKTDMGNHLLSGKGYGSKSVPFELYKRRTTIFVQRETFLNIVCDVLAEYKYVGPNQRADLMLACRYLYLL